MIRIKNLCFAIRLGVFQDSQKSINLLPKLNSKCFVNNNKYNVNQSKFYKPHIPVEQLLNQNQIQFSQNATVFRLKYCFFCKKSHNNDPTNFYTLNVNKQNGLYYCHRCQAKGSYLDLKQSLLGINVDPIHNQFSPTYSQIQQAVISQTQYFIYKENMKKQEFKDVLQYLNQRGLNNQTIHKYQVGCGYEPFVDSEGQPISVKTMYFPMQKFLTASEQKKKLIQIASEDATSDNLSSQLVKIKIRGVGKQNKKYMRQFPAGPAKGIFGLNTIKKSDKVVVLTEGQLDAMSVNQSTGLPAISLPQGANSLPDAILSYFDQFEKIVLWMDNDDAGKINVQKFAQKLGVSRTHIVVNNQKQLKDANDFLQKKPQQIITVINRARTIPDQNIIQFDLLRQLIKERILNQKQFLGIQMETFSFFNKKVKGIRPGELSVISGGTGSGKTTLLSQMSIQLSKKKIPILWGSFEVRNQILVTNMLTQFSQANLKKNKSLFDQVADQFTELPLYYMAFHGSNNVNQVLGTITYAIQRYGVTFVVLDTLQFLLSGQGQGSKKFDLQDYVMSQLRSIATSHKVHIAVVIHPRKTEDSQDIGIHSIYGTSKSTQQADNIWVIQNRDGFKIFDIKKNRYDGDIGRVAMGFNKNSKSFFELKKRQLQSLFNKQKTVPQILQDRQAEKQEKNNGDSLSWMTFDEFSDGDELQLQRSKKKW